MSLLSPETAFAPEAQLGRWFLLGGLAGVCIGLLLFIPPLFQMLGDAVLYVFPSSIMGLAEPKTWKEITLLLSIEFTSQFLLYGVISLSIGTLIYTMRKWRFSRS